MFFFPIGTDRPQRQFPWMNLLIIVINAVIFFMSYPLGQGIFGTRVPGAVPPGVSPETHLYTGFTHFLLSSEHPQLYQFITYQFLHASPSHIFFNMLFLYVFGNNLNEKLGHVGYAAFYLAGGVLAGCGHVLVSPNPTLGASGSISAVTGLFLVLLPRTHIKIFFSLFFLYMDVYEIPSIFFVLLRIGQDIYEGMMGGSNVANMAHLSGTIAGIAIGLLLLFSKLVQRDHYDLLAMFARYKRRVQYQSLVAGGFQPFESGAGVRADGRKPPPMPPVDPRVESLRAEIGRLIRIHDLGDATRRYLELRVIDPGQVLPEQEQLDIANQMMSDGQHGEAAGAYEDFLRVYGKSAQRDQVTLILGLIYARYYPKPARAKELFEGVLPRLHDVGQRELAEGELKKLA